MKLKFSKMHGLGNDFMVINGIKQQIELTPERVRAWADRRFGIGFDQLLLVEKAQNYNALFRYRIFNADGGEVAQCGNGARCFARFVADKGLTDAKHIPVETSAGRLVLHLIDHDQVRVDMGIPQFEPARIPITAEKRTARYELSVAGQRVEFCAMSLGNPHAVILVDDVDSAPVNELGPLMESHEIFPEHVNVGFMQVVDDSHFRLRVYERGVGETLACGSGACAAMVAGNKMGLLQPWANADLRGGQLTLQWQGEGEPVMMTGPTALVYDGEIDYE